LDIKDKLFSSIVLIGVSISFCGPCDLGQRYAPQVMGYFIVKREIMMGAAKSSVVFSLYFAASKISDLIFFA
jgi:hypothetical protein